MTDDITIDQDAMTEGVERVMAMAEAYSNSIDVLQKAAELSGKAFEDTANSPEKAWQEYCNAIWGCLADSQDNVNDAAELLAKYTKEMFDVDSNNAETLKSVGDLADAEKPKEGK